MRNLRPRINGKVQSTSAFPTPPSSQPSVTPKSATKKPSLRDLATKKPKSTLKPVSNSIQKNSKSPTPKTTSKKIIIKLNFARPRAESGSTIYSDVSYESGCDDDVYLSAVDKYPYENPPIQDFLENSMLPVVMQSTESYRPFPAEKGQKYRMVARMELPRARVKMVRKSGFTHAMASGFWGD